ncbi:MazG-like family protein [Phaeacidiphilus oryzae]|uniref:MazG-like family protein n=1 Tax=Phaeacidiphilus oryzae TaxID=348818 RepID=UPI0005654F3B|nr:MazG-like family protein [Phaeacidiphilus oryzae]
MSGAAAEPWSTVRGLVDWLDAENGGGPQETAMRLMKLGEEAGEAMAAYIGLIGQNPRKGRTHEREDVADELCDVIVTAMVALHSFADDPAGHFAGKLRRIAERADAARGSSSP